MNELFINVKDVYGAYGDNSTDDTVAIQTAIDSGKDLCFPEGNYLISEPLVLHTDGQVLCGSGQASSITYPDAVTNGDGNFRIEASRVTLKDLRLTHDYDPTVLGDALGVAIYWPDSLTLEGVRLLNLTMENLGHASIHPAGGNSLCVGWEIIGGVSKGVGASGPTLSSAIRCLIHGHRVEDTSDTGIALNAGSLDSKISDCTLFNIGTNPGSAGAAAIATHGQGIIISGNTIRKFRSTAISTTGDLMPRNILIADNAIAEPLSSAIGVSTLGESVTIENNTFDMLDDLGGMRDAIQIKYSTILGAYLPDIQVRGNYARKTRFFVNSTEQPKYLTIENNTAECQRYLNHAVVNGSAAYTTGGDVTVRYNVQRNNGLSDYGILPNASVPIGRLVVEGNDFDCSTAVLGLRNTNTVVSLIYRNNRRNGVRADTYAEVGGAPTITNIYSDIVRTAAAVNPASLAAGVVQTIATVTVTGAVMGDMVAVSHSVSLGGTRIWGEVTAADTVTVYQYNPTASAVDVGSGTLKVRVIK